MKKKNKLISLILSVVMLVTLVPADAFAAADGSIASLVGIAGAGSSVTSYEADTGTKSTSDVVGVLSDLGYSEMSLSRTQLERKQEMYEVVETLEDATPGEDYATDLISYMASSRKEAENVADCYNAKLVFFQNGYAGAYVDFSEEIIAKEAATAKNKEMIPTSVAELVELAADTNNNLPAIYPAFIVTSEEDYVNQDVEMVEMGSDPVDEEIMGSDPTITTVSANGFPDYVAANESIVKQWFHKYIGSSFAWDKGITGKDVVVAVIDTGIDMNSPDLKDKITEDKYNMLAKFEEIEGEKNDSYELYKGKDNDPSDDDGHGTHCAGIIAAANNTYGGVGIAYDAKIMPIKVFGYDGNTYDFVIAAAVEEAANHENVDIISMSIGGGYADKVLQAAVENAQEKGKILVASAANDGRTEMGQIFSYPASFDGVISVGALSPGRNLAEEAKYRTVTEIVQGSDKNYSRRKDEEISKYTELMASYTKENGAILAQYSQYNSKVGILAPGTVIYSTYLLQSGYEEELVIGEEKYFDYYSKCESTCQYASGTSMACPLVAGLCALILQANPDIKKQGANTSKYMYELLKQTSDKKTYSSTYNGFYRELSGCVDVEKAITLAESKEIISAYIPEKPQLNIGRNSDGTYKSGDNSLIAVDNISTYQTGTKLYYTLDGSEPTVEKGILYEEGATVGNIKNSATIKMIAEWHGSFSEVAEISGKFVASVSEIAVSNSEIKLQAGKSTDIDLDFAPAKYKNVKLQFESDNQAVSVSPKGIVRVANGTPVGTKARILVTDTYSGTKAEVSVEVVDAIKQTIALPDEYKSTITLFTHEPIKAPENQQVSISENIVKKLVEAGSEGTQAFSIRVSNKSVLAVRNGMLYGKKAGNAKVTIKTTDGSKKTKTIKVKVVCPVTEASLSTSTGCDLDYANTKAFDEAIFPLGDKNAKVKLIYSLNEGAKNPGFTYSWAEEDNGKIKISSAGVITPGKKAQAGDIIKVTATSRDGYGLTKTFRVEITPVIKGMYVAVADKSGKVSLKSSAVLDKVDICSEIGGYVKLYNPKEELIPSSSKDGEIVVYVKCDDIPYLGVRRYSKSNLMLSSSAPDVVMTINSGGYFYAKNIGTSILTLMARDGSNKKVKVKVNIVDED